MKVHLESKYFYNDDDYDDDDDDDDDDDKFILMNNLYVIHVLFLVVEFDLSISITVVNNKTIYNFI